MSRKEVLTDQSRVSVAFVQISDEFLDHRDSLPLCDFAEPWGVDSGEAYWRLLDSYGPEYGQSAPIRVQAESCNPNKTRYWSNCLFRAITAPAEL